MPANDTAKSLLKEMVEEKQANLRKMDTNVQESRTERETQLYYEAYEQLQEEITDYAIKHGIDIVLRDTSRSPKTPTDRNAVMSKLQRDVVYIRDARIDITDAIIKRLRERAEEEETRR
jgi:Skp family chaperone for outer membrane proteins